MRIGELARHTGISERMLRYYEQRGLLRPARRASGYRDYGAAEVQTAQHIRLLGASGLTVETMRVLLPCMRGEQPTFEPCSAVRAALHREMEQLDGRLRDLTESRRIVAGFLGSLPAASERGDAR